MCLVKVCIKLILIEVQGIFSLSFGFCEGLRAFSILFCSSLVFHWYPRLEGPLLVTLFRVLLGQLARGGLYASLYDDIQTTRHVCKFFASPIHSFTTHGKFVFFWVYMNLLILYSHMDLFAIPRSERGGLYITPFTVWVLRC